MTSDATTGALQFEAGSLGPAVGLEESLAGPLAGSATASVRNDPRVTPGEIGATGRRRASCRAEGGRAGHSFETARLMSVSTTRVMSRPS
jgi:hypothetical protein